MASEVDLLIVGAGPAGLMLAAWASQYSITTRLIDHKPTKTKGQADGLHSRTLEIMDSFGVVEPFLKQSYKVNEICSWNPDPGNPEHIRRTGRAASQATGLSRYGQVSLSQGATEQILLDYLDAKDKVKVERNMMPESMSVDEGLCSDSSAHPLLLELRNTAKQTVEAVRAKYVVGCDGARSWVRRQLGIPMEGDRTNRHFGVMDIVPLTDFPDIRQSCVIHSNSGSIMTVPRENRLVRLYVQLGETPEGKTVDRTSITSQTILDKARPILEPYSLDFRICDWQSVYTIGQRVAPRFSHLDRIFLCGDAVHTHSPTIGQGMNVSMQDAYNLGWKLGSLLERTARPEILSTYNNERHSVALDLIALDKRMTDFYSNGPSDHSQEYQSFRDSFSRFLSGVDVTYRQSILVTGAQGAPDASNATRILSDSTLAPGIHIGRRMPSARVVCQAEAAPVNLANALPSNGKWRVMVFGGDITHSSQRNKVRNLGPPLEQLRQKYNLSTQASRSPLEVILVHRAKRTDFSVLDLHPVYRPWDDEVGYDYWRIFSDDAAEFEPWQPSAHDNYGIDARKGCLVVVRPDQHTAYVGPMEDAESVAGYFDAVMTTPQSVDDASTL